MTRRVTEGSMTRSVTALVFCGLWAGCTGDPATVEGLPSVRVDTLESGRIVVTHAAGGQEQDPPAWGTRELFRVGTSGGEGPDLFGEIVAVEIDAGGRVYVLDGQSADVRVFDTDGSFVRVLGGPGQGPGELNTPLGLAFDEAGLLWVVNWGNARYTAFDVATGRLATEEQRRARYGVFPWPGGIDSSGRVTDVGLDAETQLPVIVRLDSGFVPVDTLPWPEERPEHQIAFLREGTMIAATPVPFAPRQFWAARPAGGIVIGGGDGYRLNLVDFLGDTTLTIAVDRERLRVTEAEREEALSEFRVVEEQLAAAGAVAEREVQVPDVKPSHGRIFVDRENAIWVETPGPAGTLGSWDVFVAGRLVATMPIPVPLTVALPVVRGDRLAVPTTSGGAPTVVVYEIVRR